MRQKPILLGMNNPLSLDPEYALFPAPEGCTGHRIWLMLTERTGCTRRQYLDAFYRRNLLNAKEWDALDAQVAAKNFLQFMREEGRSGTTIVVLGDGPRRALGLRKQLIEPIRLEDFTLRQIPHPSGRCRFYNDPVCRAVVALLLEELYHDSTRKED